MKEEWKLVATHQMRLMEYPCGVQAGDILRLRGDLRVRDHRNQPTNETYPAGEENVVLYGNPEEPNVIWLERPNGVRHTWDETVLETFESTGRRDPRFTSGPSQTASG